MTRPRHLAVWIWSVVTGVAVLAVGLGIHRFVAPRIVGRAVSPTGVEMCVIQKFNWSGEPFTTSFVYRRPGTNWAWCYFDHEDLHWGVSPVVVDTNRGIATFYRDGRPALSFEWATEVYRRGNTVWSTGPQQYYGPDWTPATEGYR